MFSSRSRSRSRSRSPVRTLEAPAIGVVGTNRRRHRAPVNLPKPAPSSDAFAFEPVTENYRAREDTLSLSDAMLSDCDDEQMSTTAVGNLRAFSLHDVFSVQITSVQEKCKTNLIPSHLKNRTISPYNNPLPNLQNKSSSSSSIAKTAIHSCPICQNIFRYQFLLDQHVDLHHTTRMPKSIFLLSTSTSAFPAATSATPAPIPARAPSRFSCTLCNHITTKESKLRRHMLVHAAKQFQCASCHMAFSNEISLSNHTNLHTQKIIFSCGFEDCESFYFSYHQLYKHRRRRNHFPSSLGTLEVDSV
jgi:uncharacterized C2H2 Zn-finger protein